MEAKDTVMSPEQIWKVQQGNCYWEDAEKGKAVAEKQAEISFEACKVQGKMDCLLGQSAIVIEAKEAGKQESDKKWRQILKGAVLVAELKGRREVVDDIVKLMDCRLKAETFALKVSDYCEARLKVGRIK